MRHRLPSLRALQAFEATARHASVSSAAEELHVTPGAVSRLVSLLEAHFDCRLFHRRARGMVLTEKGRRYFESIKDAFEKIDAASDRLLGAEATRHLSVRAYTTFATEWLIPRLADFRMRYPGIDLRLDASLKPVDFRTEALDAGLVRGHRAPQNAHCVDLFKPLMFPVASPALLRGGVPLRDPDDLRRHTIVYSSIQLANWRLWLDHAGVEIDLDRGLFFENSSLAYHAAREGAGVTMGQPLFLAEDLLSGRLFAPFPLAIRSDNPYVLACPAYRAGLPHVAAFRDWLVEAVHAAERVVDGILESTDVRVVEAATF